MLHYRYSHAPHSQVGVGCSGGWDSVASAEVIAAATNRPIKNHKAMDRVCLKVFIVMYYMTNQQNLYALLAIRILLVRLEGPEPPFVV